MGNLGGYLQRFAHRCGSIAVYPTDNLTAKRYGGENRRPTRHYPMVQCER